MAAEVGASAAAQQQIALPPEGADITNIQDEDLLRRMWQATEDFGRKKEIRARMYKLREQRLKEFYTTGEVLKDLMSTTLDSSTSATETSANNGSTIVTTRRTTYAASESGDSVGGGGLVVTTETIRGGGGSQESLIIRYRSGGNEDENLKNIEMDRRQLQGSSELIYESGGKTTRSTRSAMSSSNQAMITKSSSYGIHSQSLADQSFLNMKSKEIRDSESPTRDFSHLHNRQLTSSTHGGPGGGGYWYEESRSYHSGDDGADVVQYGTRGGQQAYSSSADIEYGDGGATTYRTGESAVKSDLREQTSSSTKMDVSSTKVDVSSSHQERSASSSYSFSSSSTQDWVQKHQDDESFVHDQTKPLQIESVRSGAFEESTVKERESMDGRASVHVEKTSKTERVSDVAENQTRISKEETESHRTTTEKVEVEGRDESRGPKQKVTQRSKTGELPLEVNITKTVTTEITSSVPSTATSTPLPDCGPTPDGGSWTVVSGKQNGVCSSTDEFVFRSGTTTETSNTRDTNQRITKTDSTNDSTVILETQKVTTDVSAPSAKPAYCGPAAGKPTPVESPVTSPSVEVKSIMKQTTTTTTTASTPQAPTQSNYYIQTKRISTEVSPTHDAFARSLRASPEKTQTYTTRASSKTSIDTNTTILSSPTRPQRTSVASPSGRSSSPERGSSRPRDRSSPMKQQTPSPSASKEKRKLSSSLSKGIGGKRTATPGASPSASPVRGRSPCSDDDEPRRRVGTSPEKKKSTVTREGSPFLEQSRKSPAKETKPSLRKTPEKSPARDVPDTHQESPKRKPSETTITKETKTTTSIGRRPSKGPKDEKPVVRKPSTDRLTSPASSPMKDKGPEFPKEKKPGDDKTPTSPQRPKDLDLKTRPTAGTKLTPSSPLEKTPTKPKEQDKPKDDKRRPSKDSTEPQSPKTHRISKADQPEEFEVVCEAPETFDVKIITPIVHSVEYPTDEPGKTKKTPVEEDTVSKKIEHELEIERLKKPSTFPVVIPTEEDIPQKPQQKTPITSGVRPVEEDSETPREPTDSYEKAPIPTDSDTPGLRPTRKDSLPRMSPSKEEYTSPVREAPKSPRRSPIRDSPVRDTQFRQSPSPSRDSPIRDTKRPTSPLPSPSRKSPARDSHRAYSSSPAREIQRKKSPSPARDMPSPASPLRRSPIRESPKKKSPSPAKELPKSFSPSRQSPARDSPRKSSPARTDDSPKTYSPTRKPCTRDSPVRESSRRHSPSPAKESPGRHSPSPAKESPTRKSPARESPVRESPRKHSPSPIRDTPTKRPVGKSPERDGLRKSPARDIPTKPSKERESPFRRRPEEKPSPDKTPARKPSIKDSSRKESPVRKTPERDTTGKSPVRQSPSRDVKSKSPDRESPKKTPTRPSPAKEAPKRDSSPKKPCDHDVPRKPSLTRKASDKAIPKKDTIARRSQSTEIPAAKRASPFKDSPKTDDIPQRRAPAAQSPVRKSPPKETSFRKIPQYSSTARQPTDTTMGDSPNADKPWRQTPVKAAPKDKTETPAKTPVKEYPPSGIPRTMSPARRPVATDSLPSSPESSRPKESKPQKTTSSPEKSPPSQRPSRSPERSPARKQPETSKPVSRIPGRASASNITPPSQKRQTPTSSIPSYTAPLRRTPKDECCPHHHEESPRAQPKGTINRPQPGSKIPESNVRRPGESSVDRKSTKITTTTTRKTKKPKKQRPLSGTDSEEEVSSTETDDDEKECVEERVMVTEKEVRSVSELYMQDMSKPHYPMQNGGLPDRPVSLSLITTATKTVTSGGEVQQTIDSEGNVTTTTYQQPSTITMSVSCKNTDYDGKEVTHTVRKTTYPDGSDEDEDVEILEIDDEEDTKLTQAIEYPYDEESPKVPKQEPTQTSPKRFGSPGKPMKKETKPQTGPGRRPTTESPVRRQPYEAEPAKKRIPTSTTPSSTKQPTSAKSPSSAPRKPTQPIAEPQDENTSPKSLRKPGQISRLPAKQAPKQEPKKITSITGKTTIQKGKTTVTTMVSSTARQKSTFASSTVEKTQIRQPLKGAPQPKQMKPAPKGKIPQKTGKGIPVKDTKKRVSNGHVPQSVEPEEDETDEEIDEKETPIVSDVEKTEYYDEEGILDEEKVIDTVTVSQVASKPVEEKPQGLHPSTAFTSVTGIQTTTEIRQVSRESTPDAPGRRPRYADRVSEPDDDDLYYEEKGATRITRRDQEIIEKKTVDKMERPLTVTMPRLETVEQRYEEEEELREFERTEMEQRRQVRTEQVTDLDEDEPKPEDEDDIEPANLSVASKVSRFLTASATAAAPPQPSQAPKMEPRGARRPSWEPEDSPRQPKGDEVDQKSYKTEELSSFAVKRARDIFETIAKTPSASELTPTTPKLKTDVLGKASLFETKQSHDYNRVTTKQTLRKSFTGSDESLGEEGLPKEKPCTDYTESEEDYDDEPIEQVKESPTKKPITKDTTPFKPQYEKDLPREISPGRTFKAQPEKNIPKETSPSRTFKPHAEREAPKESIRKSSKPLTEQPYAPKEKPSLRDETYDEPSDEELPEGDRPKKTTPYESSPATQEPTTPKTTDTDGTRRKNIFRDTTTPKEEDQVPKVKKTSIGSGMGREAFLKRMSKFATTEETKTVSTVSRETPKTKPAGKVQPKQEGDEPKRRPSKDSESPSRRPSMDSTRRVSRDEPEYRRSPARDVSKPSTDTFTRRPSKDQPRSDVESPRRTPTREIPSQPSESPRRTDTYTRKTSKEIYRSEVESPRRTPSRETPTQQSETPRRPSTDTFTKRPRDRPAGDAESPRKTPTRETPTQARKPQEERRPSTDTSRRLSKEFPKDDATPKGATFTRRPSKDRVREDEVPKRPLDGTFTRKPKITTEDDSPRPDDSYPRGSDTFTRRPSKDRQSPKRDSPMRAPEEDLPRSTGTYTRKTSTERFKESSPSPRSSPARDIQPKRTENSPRRPSQDRMAEDKPRGSDTFTRRRSQPREEEPKKPESAVDALKPYLRTRTQEFQDDDKKLKPDDKTPKKLSSSRFETFTKRDSSTSVTKDEPKRLLPVNVDRTPKKLSGSRFETFTKRDSATSVKATESVVSRTKTTTSTTRKSVEREVETREEMPECEELPRYAPEESPAKPERKTPERTPEKIEKRPAERVERTPDRKTPDRKTPDRRDDSPASFGEPLRKKPTKDVEDEPVRKAPRPDDEEIEPRSSIRRRPSKEGSPRPEGDEIPDQQRRRSSGGKFGVVLRQSSSVGSRVEALLSKVEKRTGTTTTATVTLTPTKRRPSKGPDASLEIEEIFDLEFLEQTLEKATDYDQRRRIRAQIRIVRRGEGRPEGAKEAPKEPTRPSTLVSKTKTPTHSAPPAEELDAEEKGKAPRRPSQTRESPEKVTTVPSLTRKPSRAEEVGGELTSPSVVAKLLPSSTTGTPTTRPSPSSTPKKNSLTSSSGLPREACPTDSITSSYGVGPTDESGRPLFGLRALRRPQQQAPDSLPSAPAPSPITQSREASLEPRPQSPERSDVRDSSGRPLFGLRAITISSTSKTTKEGRRVIDSRPKSPETGERPGSESPSEDEEDSVQRRDMPSTSTASTTETSVHLRDLVRRHEQHARGNAPSQPVQKPKARLRDSFILPQHLLDDEEEDVVEEGRSKPVETSPASKTFPSALPSSVAESGKIVAERSCTLKSIIQKHEKNTDSEYSNDKLNRRDSGLGAYTEEEELVPAKNNYCRRAQDYSTDEDEEDDYDDEEYQEIENGQRQETTTVKVTSDIVKRPGILKKPKDEVTETTTATCTSSNVRSQQSEKSGYVSLKKDVIQSVEDSEGAVDDEDDEEVVSRGKGRTPKGSTGRRPSNDQDEAPSSRATYSSYTTSSSSSSVARSGGEVERRRSSTSTPYRVDEEDGDSNDGIEVIRSPSDNRFSSTTTTVTRRVQSGSESPKVVTTTTTVKRATGRPDEEQTEVLVQDSRRKKFEAPSAAPTSPSPATAFPRITRGGSVRALSQKFQQAAAEAASGGPDSPSRTYPKAGLIFRTASFRQTSLSSPPNSPHTPIHSPSAPCIPTTANVNGHAGTKTTVGEVVERRTVTSTSARATVQKDDSDSDYSQQIRRRSVENDRGSSPTSRRSAEMTTVSRTPQPIVDEYDDEDVHARGESVTVEQRTVVVTNGSTGSRSFIGNQTKVTGVQDVLSRMREADNEGPAEGDTVEDSEARALLNKFLGAQVILQGMEPLINAQSPSLVRQVEKQRVQKKQESTTVVYSPDIDLDGIWDERRLRQLLESCSDYDGRRKIRARIRTVMAEQKVTAEIVAEGRLEAEREESARSKAIVSKQVDDGQMETSTTVLRSVQGELLPLIVDQLKTSLERGEGSGGGPLSGFRISSSSSEEGPFDSGTESGDDRRNQRKRRIQQQQMRQEATGGEEGDAEYEEEEDEDVLMPHGEFSSFMEGLKTSIEEAAARRRRERASGDGEDSEGTPRENRIEKQLVNNDKKGVAGVGGELLTEVHTALDKLHGTLQTSTGLDPEKSQALISLISRLQTSLEEEQKNRKEIEPVIIPPPAAPPPRTVVPDWKARCQRKRQGRAHTVGVSQEELENARRLLQSQEKEKEEEEKGLIGEKEGNQITSSVFPTVSECKSYSLMKQSSAGDLAPPSWATNSVAARVFRPVRFEPRNSPSWASMFNKTAKPFQREALGKNPPQAPKYPIVPPSLPPPPAQPQLAPPSAASRSPNVQKAPEPFGAATTPKATPKPPEIPPKPSFNTPPAVSYLSQNHYVPPPATAPAVPRSPTGPPIWQAPYSPNPPTLSSSGTSSGTTGLSHRDSESSISGSVSTKPETEDEEDERPENGKEVRVNGEGVTEEEEDDDDENESEEVTQVTQREVKPYTNGVSSYGVRNIEPLLATASEFRPSEKRSVHHSLSLDSGTKRAHEDTLTTPGDVGKRASPLARSWTLDDPSALLFTQAESVQIAVHKAAIKKQLTQEEEQRMRLPPKQQNGLGEKIARSQSTEDAAPISNGDGPVLAREAGGSGSDSYAECGSEVRINGDGYVHRTTSGSSVSSVASSRNSATVPNGIYGLNNGNENQNPPVPPRRESIPVANSYENNSAGNIREYDNANGDGGWNQGKSQGTSGSEGSERKGYQNGSTDLREFPKEDSAERYRESADDELAQLHSQMSNQSRQQSKVEKKKRMKRANTIDIPKPLNFYMDEDDYSSGEEMEEDGEMKEDGSPGMSEHRAAYLALRGPIRVKIPQSKQLAPSFQAKTENDRKFLAFLEQHSGHTPNRADVQPSYHSSARGGAHWSNRFSNIKTAFEGSGRGSEHNVGYGRGRGMGRNSLGEIGGPASARNFWRAADDSVTRSRGSSHGPRLSREGSTLLRRLFEERDAAAAENNVSGKADQQPSENVGKLPWTAETQTKGEDSVVIGSLTVANKKQLFSAMKAAPPPQGVKGPVPVGKFSHAPLSAFRPIQSKDQGIVPSHGPMPLSSPGAVRLASQKFGASPAAAPAKPQVSHVPLSAKSPHSNRVAFVPAQESHSPVGGPPWAKEDAHDRVHSTSALFETRTRDPSPPPPPMSFTSHAVAHSQVYNPVQLGQPMGGVPQSPKSIAQPFFVDHSQGALLYQSSKPPQITVPTPPPRSNAPRAPMIQSPSQSRSPPPPALPPPPIYAGPSPPTVLMPVQEHPPTPSKPVYRQPSPPLHSPTVVYSEPTPPPVIPPFPRTNIEPPSPEPELQCAAVTKVMTGPVFQQAVVQKRRRGGDDEEEEGLGSAAKNLSSALHRLSVSPSRPPRITPPCPPKPVDYYPTEQSSDSGKVFSAETYLHPSHASLIGENQAVHKRESTSYSPLPPPEIVSPQNTDRKTDDRQIPEKLSLKEQEEFYQKQLQAVRDAQEARRRLEEAQRESFRRTTKSCTHENLVPPTPPNRYQRASLTSDTREENNESVVTMRLQIPVKEPERYSSLVTAHSLSPVQRGMGAIRSNSHHDVRHALASVSPVLQRVDSPRRDTEDRSPTSVLQKSESWHMLGQLGQSVQGPKRPQSIALDKRRAPPSLPKMSFPKQFEARISPETVQSKQKKVEAYLRGQALGSKPGSGTNSPSKQTMVVSEPMTPLLLDDNLENVDEAFESLFNAATKVNDKRMAGEKGQGSSKDQWPSHMELQKSQSQHLLRPPAPPRESSASPQFQRKQKAWEESCMVKTKLAQNIAGSHSEATSMSSSTDSSVTKTEVHTKTSNYSATVTGKSRVSKAPPSKTMSPFAKFKQLDEQNAGSSPNSPKSPGGTGPLFKFTDPQLSRSASGVKDKLLYWCQVKTKEYKNIQIENFSTSWSNGLAFCALIHHFCPDAFDYDTLRPEERRKNFDLAFRVADEKAGIAPLLDVEDMVTMRKPDWKCVFTYVQSIYRRFKDED